MHMLYQALIGLVIGIVAKFLLPGRDPGGIIMTALLGIAGGWVGGQIGKWFGWYRDGHPAGFGLSVVGAMILLLCYRMAVG
jgi:uncharacterized membrane protein YeaQ/YmgE (transglycosylase-associated protein family)